MAMACRACAVRGSCASVPVKAVEAAAWRAGFPRLRLFSDGQVSAHLDHWDSGMQVYARLPLLGAAIRVIARRVAAR